MDISKIDLNKPAFGEGADPADLPADASSVESQPEEEAQAEEAASEEEAEQQEESEPSEEEEQRVPYSRFKKYHDLSREREEIARAALEEAEHWRRIAELKESQPASRTDELPDYWVAMFGDSDASKEAWRIESRRQEALKEEIRAEAIRAAREQLAEESSRESENVEYIDGEIESLEEALGRPLSEKEQSALLDIVDEYTPKDRDGNYLGALLPFDKAWEIHEMKTQARKAPTQKARNAVAATSAAGTSGEATVSADRDRDFDPLNWNAWRSRV